MTKATTRIEIQGGQTDVVLHRMTLGHTSVFIGGATALLPPGGQEGQSLVKASNTSGDVKWAKPSPIDGGTFF